jgi:hypothetical protein
LGESGLLEGLLDFLLNSAFNKGLDLGIDRHFLLELFGFFELGGLDASLLGLLEVSIGGLDSGDVDLLVEGVHPYV